MKRISVVACLAVLTAMFQGCGYTTKTLLPAYIKNIHIAPVKNAINLSGELSDKERFRVYRPGVEVDLTNALINDFIFDGNLKVTSAGDADAVVEAKLTDYRRDALRYTNADDIQEYRLSITMDVAVVESKSRKELWRGPVTGDTSFYISGSHAISEDEAAAKAVNDAARRVVERTIEVWK